MISVPFTTNQQLPLEVAGSTCVSRYGRVALDGTVTTGSEAPPVGTGTLILTKFDRSVAAPERAEISDSSAAKFALICAAEMTSPDENV
jgi:hypothetical protein